MDDAYLRLYNLARYLWVDSDTKGFADTFKICSGEYYRPRTEHFVELEMIANLVDQAAAECHQLLQDRIESSNMSSFWLTVYQDIIDDLPNWPVRWRGHRDKVESLIEII